MNSFPLDQYGLIRRQALVDDGFSDARISRAVASGALHRIWPAVYLPGSEQPKFEALHRLKVIASQTTNAETATVISHQSAAVLLGMPMLMPDLSRVHVTNGSRAGGRIEKRRHIHTGVIDPVDTEIRDGVLTTNRERTAVDVACSSGRFASALAIFDSALRLDADAGRIAEILSERTSQRGTRIAREAFARADRGAANPGESWSRAQILVAGLPEPDVQYEVVDEYGRRIGICDLGWADKVMGEFDGADKYVRYLRAGETIADAVLREKKRENAIRQQDKYIARWGWAELTLGEVPGIVSPWLRKAGVLPRPTVIASSSPTGRAAVSHRGYRRAG